MSPSVKRISRFQISDRLFKYFYYESVESWTKNGQIETDIAENK